MSTALLEYPPKAPESLGRHTPEELLEMSEQRYELIDGRLVERNMGAEASEVAAKMIGLGGTHARKHKLGKFFATDCGYQIFPENPDKVRIPDGSFIARGRLPEEKAPKGHLRIAPDLAIEVVSP